MPTRETHLVVLALVLGACAGPQKPPVAPPPAAAAPAPAAPLAKAPPAVPEAPPVTLLPAATARAIELAAISVTSVDALLTKGAQLVGRAVPLPIDPSGVRNLLLSQAGLAPEVADNLDLAAPSGAALVATGRPGATGLVLAVAARGPAEAERVIGALGKPVVRRGAVVLVDNGAGGRGWVFRAGNVVVLSDEIDALTRGAMLALEARHPAPDDATAVLYPDAIAQAQGTDVKSALAALIAGVRASQAQGGAGAGAQDHSLDAMVDLLTLVADAETVEIGLSVDGEHGLTLRMRLRPRAGTQLAALARDARPFALDRLLLGGTTAPSLVGASSYGPFIQTMMAHQRERLAAGAAAKQKGSAAALEFFDAMQAGLTGQASVGCTFGREVPHVAADVSYPLKDGAAAAKLAADLGRLDRVAAGALWEAQVGKSPVFDWSVKKETVGKLKALHYKLTLRKGAATEGEPLAKILGNGVDAYVAVAETRLLATAGAGAKARLGVLAGGKQGTPQGALADALARTTGRDGFLYMDLAPVLSLAGGYAQDPRAALLLGRDGALPIPLYATIGGDGAGKVWAADLTFPPAAFLGAGALIQRLGAGGGH
jgi:hypothetical protein